MKKALSYIAFFAAAILLVSAYSERVVKAESGYHAPEIELIKNDSVNISLDRLRGRYVLVNFWDTGNAVSRIATGEYDRYIREAPHKPVVFISVNTDDDAQMFNEYVKRDNLEAASQFHISDAQSKNLRSDYRLKSGYASYLIDPQGKIILTNPSVEQLSEVLNP